jgi:transcriptional regulator with XRE-family HTH domain
MDIVELGQAFRAARIARRLTQQDAAQYAGVSVATISRFERGDLLELGVGKLISLFGLVGQELIPRPKGHTRTLDDIQRENMVAEPVQTFGAQRVRRTKAESALSIAGGSLNALLVKR